MQITHLVIITVKIQELKVLMIGRWLVMLSQKKAEVDVRWLLLFWIGGYVVFRKITEDNATQDKQYRPTAYTDSNQVADLLTYCCYISCFGFAISSGSFDGFYANIRHFFTPYLVKIGTFYGAYMMGS
ncbi:hypothetical protein V1358_11530 [Pseudoalteromonas sp. YIC-656]|uniref:hypothetical protein n=1 Tax=Pseudoalteromonas pernae TaxID=3118054 RepID=UPI0032428D26